MFLPMFPPSFPVLFHRRRFSTWHHAADRGGAMVTAPGADAEYAEVRQRRCSAAGNGGNHGGNPWERGVDLYFFGVASWWFLIFFFRERFEFLCSHWNMIKMML